MPRFTHQWGGLAESDPYPDPRAGHSEWWGRVDLHHLLPEGAVSW